MHASGSSQLVTTSKSQEPKKATAVYQLLNSTVDNTSSDDAGVYLLVKIGILRLPTWFSIISTEFQINQLLIKWVFEYRSIHLLDRIGQISHRRLMHIWEAWNSPLCHIISQDFAPDLRSRAKEMLKGITGGRRVTYRQIQDRLVFASQFMEWHSCCESPLQAALFVREKARQCGPQWRLLNITWETLSSGGLLGARALFSETIMQLQ